MFTTKDSSFLSVASLANYLVLTFRKTNYTVILINKIKLNLSENEIGHLQKIYIDQNLPWGPLIQHVN